MTNYFKFCVFLYIVCICTAAEDFGLTELFREISAALNAGIVTNYSQTRQQQHLYRPQNHGISLGVYEGLKSIARNDELGCVSRLLCEAAAGGNPGYSGKQIKFDKVSLTNLMSYLKLDPGSSSPLLVFGKAALLGVSNRGDPYSCIINYSKCPKDQSRLLHYLNNHRGGFFQYFDKNYPKPGSSYYPNHYQYRPGYYYQNNHNQKFNQNKFQFESPNGLYEKFKKKALNDIYAKKYDHRTVTFPDNFNKKPMVFPKDRSFSSEVDSRILTKVVGALSLEKDFVFSSSNRLPKKLNSFNFFPQSDRPLRQPATIGTDRLPSKFYFPENEKTSYSTYGSKYSNSFFPVT